jgi:hypothetical protein
MASSIRRVSGSGLVLAVVASVCVTGAVSQAGHTGSMLQRATGMWWGTAIEAPEPAGLAAFYAELLGWGVVHEEPGTTVLAPPQGAVYVVFQQAEGYERPTWPPVDGQQRPMMHFDFQVADLDAAVAEATRLGATTAAEQPNPKVRVLFDPAGHPFCLCLDDD